MSYMDEYVPMIRKYKMYSFFFVCWVYFLGILIKNNYMYSNGILIAHTIGI